MTVDTSKLQYYTEYNTYKNLGVFPATLNVAGAISAGAAADYTTTISLTNNYKFSTALVQTTSFIGGAVRWQAFPSSLYYDVAATGADTHLQVSLGLDINGSNLSFKAFAFNPFGSTITLTSTNISFVYAVHTTDI